MKIKIIIPDSIKVRLKTVVEEFKEYECGGILIGKKDQDNNLEIVDISIPSKNRSFSIFRFNRGVRTAKKVLKKHYENGTGQYLGEWHSHPKFSLNPSIVDINTMLGILEDRNYNVKFAVLLITHLRNEVLHYKGYLFHKDLDKIIKLENF